MIFFHKILIIFALGIVGSSARYAGRKPGVVRNDANADMAFFDGTLTDMNQPWVSDLQNPKSNAFNDQRQTYQKAITDSLTAKNSTAYKAVQVAITEFSGTYITEKVTGTIVSFTLGLPAANKPTALQVDNDLEQGSKMKNYEWRDVDVRDAGLPPLPEAGQSAGWKQAAHVFLTSINTSVDPCQDFFRYSCDNYIASHPIGDAPTQSTFDELQEAAFVNLTQAFEKLQTSINDEPSQTLKTTNMVYQACKAVTNTTYSGPDLLLQIANGYGGWPVVKSTWNYSMVPQNIYYVVGDMYTKYGVPTLLTPMVEIDGRNISRHILYLDQASLFNQAPYYQSPNLTQDAQDQLRAIIYQTVLLMADGAPVDNKTVLPQIDRMVQIEYHLAMISINGSEQRNESVGYNPYTITEAQSSFPALNWTSFANGLIHDVYPGVDPNTLLDPIIIEEPHKYGRDLNTFLDEANKDAEKMKDLVNYLIFRAISPYSQFAGADLARVFKAFKKEYDLDNPTITDQEEECVEYIANSLPYAAGRLYIDSSFPSANRDDVAVMINNVLSAFSSTLSGLQWMDNVSALRAFQKVSGLVRNVAYPDWQEDDKQLDSYHQPLIDAIGKIEPSDPQVYFEYNLAVEYFSQQVEFLKLRQPTDRTEFGMSAAIVNAWYQPIRNSITFPAAILNEPFYRYDFPQAVNYGGLGVVMGHELSHGFDDQGIQFDWDGSLHTWMTPHAEDGFDTMAQCVVDEYSGFCYPQACINGITTQGENIGDNGGLKAAFHAYQAYVNAHGEEQPLPGMETWTMEQIFFLSYGQVWCGSYSDAALTKQLLTNVHSPGKDRVIGAVKNFPKFAEVYGCKKGDPMYPVDSCDVW